MGSQQGGRVGLAIKSFVAASVLFAGTAVLAPVAEAGPSGSSCSTSQKGCVRHQVAIDTYEFNSDDGDLRNNFYHCEGIAPGCSEINVGENFGKYKKNLTSYVRFCRYSNTNYSSAQGWVTQVNVWASTAAPHHSASLRFRTSDSC